MKSKRLITGCIAIVVIMGVAFSVQSFATAESTMDKSSLKTKTFVKTKNKCTKSNCSCSGYWGYNIRTAHMMVIVPTQINMGINVDMDLRRMD